MNRVRSWKDFVLIRSVSHAQRKKFEIRAVDQPDKLTLYSGCDDKSKLLLGLCRDTHQFSMAIAPRVNEAKRREEEGEPRL